MDPTAAPLAVFAALAVSAFVAICVFALCERRAAYRDARRELEALARELDKRGWL